jgi:hypothetical protein
MVKAEDLIKQQKEREDRKYITYDKIYIHLEKKISLASQANNYFTWYQVPEILIGLPTYNLKDCLNFLKNKLKKDGFTSELYEPNIIFVSWLPKKK